MFLRNTDMDRLKSPSSQQVLLTNRNVRRKNTCTTFWWQAPSFHVKRSVYANKQLNLGPMKNFFSGPPSGYISSINPRSGSREWLVCFLVYCLGFDHHLICFTCTCLIPQIYIKFTQIFCKVYLKIEIKWTDLYKVENEGLKAPFE